MNSRFLAIADGEELGEALRRGTAGLDGWVQAVGHVEDAELRFAGDGVDPVRRARERSTLVSLAGPAGGPYGVVLSRATPEGASTLAGQLVRARSLGVTAIVVVVAGGAEVEPEPERAAAGPAPRPEPAAASSWAQQARATAAEVFESEPEDELDPVSMLEPGDRVQHFAFGLCDVLMVNGDRLKIRDVRGPGRIREISVDRLKVEPPGVQDGKRVFKLGRRN